MHIKFIKRRKKLMSCYQAGKKFFWAQFLLTYELRQATPGRTAGNY